MSRVQGITVSWYHHQPSTEMQRQPGMQEEVKPELSMKGSTQINGIKKHQSSRRLIAKVFAIMQHALNFYSTALQVCSCLLQQTKKYEKTTQQLLLSDSHSNRTNRFDVRYGFTLPSPCCWCGFDMLDPYVDFLLSKLLRRSKPSRNSQDDLTVGSHFAP